MDKDNQQENDLDRLNITKSNIFKNFMEFEARGGGDLFKQPPPADFAPGMAPMGFNAGFPSASGGKFSQFINHCLNIIWLWTL